MKMSRLGIIVLGAVVLGGGAFASRATLAQDANGRQPATKADYERWKTELSNWGDGGRMTSWER